MLKIKELVELISDRITVLLSLGTNVITSVRKIFLINK